jgi:curved DNA-binding protein
MVTLDEAVGGSLRAVSVRRNAPCAHCDGTGRRAGHVCNVCGGTGRVPKTETYQVSAGDLFLRVRLARHPDFAVEDHNLIYEAELAPWEAVLGGEISVPTLNGRINIRVPPGTQNGQKLRVRGRGLPERAGGKGDLIVTTRVEVPSQLTDSERKLWEQLARESKFNPRERNADS